MIVTGFDISCESKQGNILPMMSSGSYLWGDQKEAIRHLRKGDRIVFENIQAESPDSIARGLESFTITIL